MIQNRNQRSAWRWALSLLLIALGVLVTLDIWIDVVRIALHDEEASHILLVPVVAIWLVWVRRSRLRYCRMNASWWGPVAIALGWTLSSLGFTGGTQVLWHGGAVLVLIGCLITLTGTDVLRKFLPAFLVLVFLLPVPGLVRQQIAIPLQTATARVTQWVFEAAGASIGRSGNVLTVNGVEVAIAEACNGMRMVFSLALVSFAFAFGIPLRNPVRVLVLLASPVCAIAANVLRMLPTVWIYGTYSTSVAEAFHDISGWLMLPLALLVMVGVVRVLRWALVPVTRFTLAYQ
jgi:exosortase